MLLTLRKIIILLSFAILIFMIYEAGFKDSSRAWINYQEPKLAAHASLEEDEKILKELDRQTQFGTYKTLDPAFFVKPNIFNSIENR